MTELKLKLKKTAKNLNIICLIFEIAMIISISMAFLGILLTIFIDETFLNQIQEILMSEDIITRFDEDIVASLSQKGTIILSAIVHIISRSILLVYLFIFSSILKDIARGEQAFTEKNAKIIFYVSLSVLLFALSNPLIAVFLCFVGIFLSQLVKYGAYLNKKAEETNTIQENMIVSFAEVVENKSEQTGKHVKRVAEYSYVLALAMGLDEEEAEKIKLASMMHDIGKLLVPTEILEKPARLSDEEFQEIKKHPGYGVQLLNTASGDVLVLAKKIAHDHHERIDGNGYPDHLKSQEISLEGRIVSVADVYDALTSKRSYKEAWDERRAYEEIVKGSGTQFDTRVVEAFKTSYNKINEIRLKFVD